MPVVGNFAAQVDKWVTDTQRRTIAVVRESAALAAESLTKPRGSGGNMPVVTGNLRRSLAASLSGRPTIDWSKGHKFNDLAEVENVIRAAEPGHTIFLGFRAPYAEKAEFRDGNGFWRLTVQKWPRIVEEAVKRVKAGAT